MKTKKRLICLMVCCAFLLCMTGCNESNETSAPTEVPPTETVAMGEDQKTATDEEIEAYQKSTADNDTDLGLKSIKLDLAMGDLNDDQKMVIEYFKRDYMFVNSIEALQRYPQIFDNSLIEFYGRVEKIMDSNNDTFTVLVSMMQNSNEVGALLDPSGEYYAEYASFDLESRYMVIQGKQTDKRLMLNDFVRIDGRYKGTNTYEIDGSSYVVPTISVHYVDILNDSTTESGWNEYGFFPSRFSSAEVKRIAETIFGDAITVSLPDWDDEEDWAWMEFNYDSVYVCVLDNQSNAKFSKFYFTENQGWLEDSQGRIIEFSADFQHFFLFSYDDGMEILTLEYYDQDLNRIWKREFEEATTAEYDFTKNNAYIQVNNELYIINIETGEDTFYPAYVGKKLDVRKLNDGMLMIGHEKSDAVFKTDLEGNTQWRLNLKADVYEVEAVQVYNDQLLIKYSEYIGDDGYGGDIHYAVIDNATGELLQDVVIGFEYFHQYN